jgi:hypothetical protein
MESEQPWRGARFLLARYYSPETRWHKQIPSLSVSDHCRGLDMLSNSGRDSRDEGPLANHVFSAILSAGWMVRSLQGVHVGQFKRDQQRLRG